MIKLPKTKLHTENIGGNLHEAATNINKMGWADYVLSMSFNGGNYTVAVFRMPIEMVHKIRKDKCSYVSDPHHDNYKVPDNGR